MGEMSPYQPLAEITLSNSSLEWVWWFNSHRLLGPIGYVPAAEYEQAYYTRLEARPEPAGLNSPSLR